MKAEGLFCTVVGVREAEYGESNSSYEVETRCEQRTDMSAYVCEDIIATRYME